MNLDNLIIAAGNYHTLISTGSELWGWGDNRYGQIPWLGKDTEEQLRPKWLKIGAEPSIIKIAAGAYFTLILTRGGLFVCGRNDYGQLGLGHTKDQYIPQRLSIPRVTRITDIAAGEYHTIIVTDIGLFVCGRNNYGQLGLGHTKDQYIPQRLSIPDFAPGTSSIIDIATGRNHTLILTNRNGLYGWGQNYNGQIVDLPDFTVREPLHICVKGRGEMVPLVGITAGGRHTILKFYRGKVYLYGNNDYAQCEGPDGVTVDCSDIAAIAAGGNFSFFLFTDGFLYGVGDNCCGQLGIGRGPQRQQTLQQLSSMPGVRRVITRHHNTLISTANGLFVFGNNEHGQLGLGDKVNRYTPQRLIIQETDTDTHRRSLEVGRIVFLSEMSYGKGAVSIVETMPACLYRFPSVLAKNFHTAFFDATGKYVCIVAVLGGDKNPLSPPAFVTPSNLVGQLFKLTEKTGPSDSFRFPQHLCSADSFACTVSEDDKRIEMTAISGNHIYQSTTSFQAITSLPDNFKSTYSGELLTNSSIAYSPRDSAIMACGPANKIMILKKIQQDKGQGISALMKKDVIKVTKWHIDSVDLAFTCNGNRIVLVGSDNRILVCGNGIEDKKIYASILVLPGISAVTCGWKQKVGDIVVLGWANGKVSMYSLMNNAKGGVDLGNEKVLSQGSGDMERKVVSLAYRDNHVFVARKNGLFAYPIDDRNHKKLMCIPRPFIIPT